MVADAAPLQRRTFEAQQLMADHPPVMHNVNKQVVQAISCPRGSVHRGQLHYSRWPALALPDRVDLAARRCVVNGRPDFYDYAPVLPGAVEWHVNFADPLLFGYYGSPLLAQDEMQVTEHPSLAALKEALAAEGRPGFTREDERPTPVLVMSAERRSRIAVDPSAAEGRPTGLYGNAFARASIETIILATERIDPPTVTNVIAMSAPSGGYGEYDADDIEDVLVTAYTAFVAARIESNRMHGQAPVVVHTGFWGCGAFGGNRVLMAMLQILAAEMAGIARVEFHAGDDAGMEQLAAARELIEQGLATLPIRSVDALIETFVALGFEWGVGDGN